MPFSRRMWNCSGLRTARHSSSDFTAELGVEAIIVFFLQNAKTVNFIDLRFGMSREDIYEFIYTVRVI